MCDTDLEEKAVGNKTAFFNYTLFYTSIDPGIGFLSDHGDKSNLIQGVIDLSKLVVILVWRFN
ncbi:hypothetical protein DMA11_16905 [Marinilabiliaceae bacterium JC017]|nr:hypothetical protein DMA11_16905 [Marinilabiliaceae bacterium JC017]